MVIPLFSIIIPVFNVEKYLDECVTSIVSQDFSDYEIILVDDGSTDSSGTKCDWWAKEDHRVSVIHKTNGGLSSARNAGLERAVGEFILFVDSDDRIISESLGIIAKRVYESQSDIFFLNAIKFYPNGRRESLDEPMRCESIRGKSRSDVMDYLSRLVKYPGSSWAKLYRRQFLDSNGIRFPSDRRISEDLGFVLTCLITADSFDVINTDHYEYRQNREGSLTSKATSADRAFWDLTLFLKESIAILTDNMSPKNRTFEYALSFTAYEYSIALLKYPHVTNRAEAKKLLLDYQWVCNYARSQRGIFINMMIKWLGIDLTSFILSLVYHIRENAKRR